jgi:hypothetical protein
MTIKNTVEFTGNRYTCCNQCPKFNICNAPICPLDEHWRKRKLTNGDSTCYYLTESVKRGAGAVFEGAGLGLLLQQIVAARQSIIDTHPRIKIALQRASLSGSRMTRKFGGNNHE